MQPSYLSRHDREFLIALQHQLWEVDPQNPLGRKIPHGFISRTAFLRVMSIMSDGCLGLALHLTRHSMGITAMFYPMPKKNGRRYEDPCDIVVIHDSHLEGPMDEASIIERRNQFFKELFPFTKTPMNAIFRDRIHIGGTIDEEKFLLTKEPHETPATELSLEDWAFYDGLEARLWHIGMRWGDRPRDFHRQVPTHLPRGRISSEELETIKRDIENEKIIATIIERDKYGGLTVILMTRPWSRLPKSPKRSVLSLGDCHMMLGKEDAAYRERCLSFFKPLILLPSNITALEQYSDGIPRLLRAG